MNTNKERHYQSQLSLASLYQRRNLLLERQEHLRRRQAHLLERQAFLQAEQALLAVKIKSSSLS